VDNRAARPRIVGVAGNDPPGAHGPPRAAGPDNPEDAADDADARHAVAQHAQRATLDADPAEHPGPTCNAGPGNSPSRRPTRICG
jgi:hypothetical protein